MRSYGEWYRNPKDLYTANHGSRTVHSHEAFQAFYPPSHFNRPGHQKLPGLLAGMANEPNDVVKRHGVRFLNPALNRWLSPDPILNTYLDGKTNGGVYNPINLNLYAYAANNPVMFTDTNGRWFAEKKERKGGIIRDQDGNETTAEEKKKQEACDLECQKNSDDIASGLIEVGSWTPAGRAAKVGSAVMTVGVKGSRAAKSLFKAKRSTRTAVIGKLDDLDKVGKKEYTLLNQLPDKGNPKVNWKQNSSVLRKEMRRGVPIRDASVNAEGKRIKNSGFLKAERNLLENKGWKYRLGDKKWYPK